MRSDLQKDLQLKSTNQSICKARTTFELNTIQPNCLVALFCMQHLAQGMFYDGQFVLHKVHWDQAHKEKKKKTFPVQFQQMSHEAKCNAEL